MTRRRGWCAGLLLALLLTPGLAFGQAAEATGSGATGSEALAVPPDRSAQTPRAAPTEALDRLRSDRAYAYGDRVDRERPSLLVLFWQWLRRTLLDPLFGRVPTAVSRAFWLVGAALLLAWLAFRLIGADASALFGRGDPRRRDGAAPLLDVDDLGAVDLGERLAEALARGDFREAVRYRYLLALQRLDASGAIAWDPAATNRDYALQVRRAAPALSRPFAEATRAFDYVWYGRLAVDAARYERLGGPFAALEAALARAPARPLAR